MYLNDDVLLKSLLEWASDRDVLILSTTSRSTRSAISALSRLLNGTATLCPKETMGLWRFTCVTSLPVHVATLSPMLAHLQTDIILENEAALQDWCEIAGALRDDGVCGPVIVHDFKFNLEIIREAFTSRLGICWSGEVYVQAPDWGTLTLVLELSILPEGRFGSLQLAAQSRTPTLVVAAIG